MKVRMKTTAAGPSVYHMKGTVVDISEAQADLYVNGGYAEYFDAPKEAAVQTAGEAPSETDAEEEQEDALDADSEPEKTTAKKAAAKKKA